ncbi:YkvA family protein [Pantoea piersonii]|uniref:YkvA family protein n=1 Tax=Pantoea piersonii TaxID=2364647 RepID=UPI0022F18FC9|nr:YkvA family protein [Pantoea piersonii]WBV22721.1 YkvA family protein [Pantoea piersonii]
MLFARLRRWAALIKKDVLTLWFACRDPRTPWWFKLLAFGLVAYALSPIDLIPDFIPIVGLLDDAIIIPLGVLILLRLLPRDVRISSAERAEVQRARGKKIVSGFGLVLMVLIWLAVLFYLVHRYAM